MHEFKFEITCPNEKFCKKMRKEMKDYENISLVNKPTIHDHEAIKEFSSWEEARSAYKEIMLNHPDVVNMKLVQV